MLSPLCVTGPIPHTYWREPSDVAQDICSIGTAVRSIVPAVAVTPSSNNVGVAFFWRPTRAYVAQDQRYPHRYSSSTRDDTIVTFVRPSTLNSTSQKRR